MKLSADDTSSGCTRPNFWEYIGYCHLGVGCGNLCRYRDILPAHSVDTVDCQKLPLILLRTLCGRSQRRRRLPKKAAINP